MLDEIVSLERRDPSAETCLEHHSTLPTDSLCMCT